MSVVSSHAYATRHFGTQENNLTLRLRRANLIYVNFSEIQINYKDTYNLIHKIRKYGAWKSYIFILRKF